MESSDGLHPWLPWIESHHRRSSTLCPPRNFLGPWLPTLGTYPLGVDKNKLHAKRHNTPFLHYSCSQTFRMWLLRVLGSLHDTPCIFCFHFSKSEDLPTFQWLWWRRGFKRAIVSGSNMSSGQWTLPWTRENCVSAIFPYCFHHTPVMREGQIKMCLDRGNMCLTSHICSTAIFANAGGGHQINDPSGYKNTA